MRRPNVTRLAMGAVIGGSLVLSSAARAEPPKDDVRRADELFQEGRAMMVAGKLPEACVKLEESVRLAGGLGTLINLGACHERSGKLALAYAVFSRSASVARHAGRLDREKEAADRASALLVQIGRVRVVPLRPNEEM